MAVKSYEDLKEKTIAMTGFFETSQGYPECYGISSGNHDGAGLSAHVLQFNFGTGSLQPLWNFMNNNHNQLCRDIFGADYTEWVDVLGRTTAEQVTWGDSISVPVGSEEKRGVAEPWKTHIMNLGTTQVCIDKQMEYAEAWRPNAEKWFKTLGLYSRRGFALVWDISVQMGRLKCLNLIYNDFKNIDPTGKTRAQIEEEKLYIICNRASYHNRPNSASDIVYNRKKMLIDGTGDYYGAAFTMAQYDLNYEPAFEWNEQGGLYFG
jgi:hypothetical protein